MRIEELSNQDLLKLYNTSKQDINSQSKSIGVHLMEEEIHRRKLHTCFVCGGEAVKRMHTGEDRGFFYLCSNQGCSDKLHNTLSTQH